MNTAYLALGSNRGDRLHFLRFALTELEQREVMVEVKSRIYRSESVGSGGEGEFFNAVVRVSTSLSALQLLGICQEIETLTGRARPIFEGAKRDGARELDIDIVMFESEISSAPRLQLPHPRALERPFVLRPLLDVLDSEEVIVTDLDW